MTSSKQGTHSSASPVRCRPDTVQARFLQAHSRTLLIVFGTAVILCLLVEGFIEFRQAREIAISQAERSLSELSSAVAARIAEPIKRTDDFLRRSAALAAPNLERSATDGGGRLEEFMTREVERSSDLAFAVVADAAGRPIFSSSPVEFSDLDVAAFARFALQRGRRADGLYVDSPVSIPADTGRSTIYVSREIVGGNGKLLGVAAALLDLRHVEEFLKSLPIGSETDVVLSRENGSPLARYFVSGSPTAVAVSDDVENNPENFVTASGSAISPVPDAEARPEGKGEFITRSQQIAPYPLVASASLPMDAAVLFAGSGPKRKVLLTTIEVVLIATLIFLLVRKIAHGEERERALRASDERYALAMAGANDGIWDWDFERDEIYMSPRINEFLPKDLQREFLSPRFASAVIHPDDAAEWKAAMIAHLKGDTKFFSRECRLCTAEGPSTWIHCRGVAVRGSDGRAYRMVGSLSDISERKNAEQALRDRESRMRAILETAVDAIVVIDSKGVIETFNPAAERMFGYGAAEVIGRNVICLMPSRLGETHDDHIKAYESTGRTSVIGIEREVEGRRKDGTEFPMELSVSEMTVGEERMFTGIIRDISERKRIEGELDRIRESLAGAQKIGHMGNWDWNIETGGLWWSDEIYRIFGQEPQSFGATYEAFIETVHPDDREFVRDSVNRALDSGVYEIDHRIVLPSGEERIVHELGKVTFDAGGAPLRMLGIVQDVTEQKQAQAALAASEQRYRDFVELTPSAILIIANDEVVFANQGAKKLFGLQRDGQLVGSAGLEHVHPDHREFVRSSIHRILESGEPLPPVESKWIRPDGSVIDAEITANRISWQDKQAVQLIALDISDRKHAEAESASWETEVHTILENMRETFYRTDPAGRIVMVSRSVEDLLGYTVDEAMGTQIAEQYADPNDRARFLEAIDRDGGKVVGYEAKLRRKDGTEIWVSTNAHKRFDADGTFIGIEGTSRDVTKRKTAELELRQARDELERRVLERTEHLEKEIAERNAAESALRNSQARLQTIMDHAVDAIVTIDEKGLIESFNPAAEKLFGFKSAEVVGKNVKLLMPESDQAHHDEYLENYRRSGRKGIVGTSREVLGRRKDGSTFPLELGVSEMDLGGRRLFTGILRDISDRKQAERKLKIALDRADTANDAKSQFLSSMSHELRTPLNAILGFGELLAKDPAIAKGKKKLFVQHILRAGEHLLRLIDDILDLSKIESNLHNLDISSVSLEEPFKECLTLIDPLAKQFGIRVTVQHNCKKLPTVRADATRMKQVLLNLLSNAIKYNRSGGSVTLVCKRSGKHRIRISVIDTGPGIPLEKHEELFKPFSRIGAEVTDIEGTGIGLALSKQLVELMGGSIGLHSEVGKGSEFWIELAKDRRRKSRNTSTSRSSSKQLRLKAGGRGQSLLYVEDNAANLFLVEQIVQEFTDLRMVSAHNAELGIEIARKLNPDIILMDINLPGIDGLEAIRRLKGDKTTRRIPVVAVSANAMPEDVKKGLNEEIKDYLIKPIKVKDLLSVIEHALPKSTRPPKASNTIQKVA